VCVKVSASVVVVTCVNIIEAFINTLFKNKNIEGDVKKLIVLIVKGVEVGRRRVWARLFDTV